VQVTENLTEREENAFEEGPRLVERFFEGHVEMVIKLLVFSDVFTDFVQEDVTQETAIS
jgi:hypothetical protein